MIEEGGALEVEIIFMSGWRCACYAEENQMMASLTYGEVIGGCQDGHDIKITVA